MSDEASTAWVHRRCDSCDAVCRTRARKAWRCPACGHRNRVPRAQAVKPQKPGEYMQVGFNREPPRDKEGGGR